MFILMEKHIKSARKLCFVRNAHLQIFHLKIKLQNWCKIAAEIGLIMTAKSYKKAYIMLVIGTKRVSGYFLTPCSKSRFRVYLIK